MYVCQICLENIRSIERLKILFPSNPVGWHVLIGDNGSGKTTVLKAVAVCLLRNATDNFGLNWNRKGTKEGGIQIDIKKCNDDDGNIPFFTKHKTFTNKNLIHWTKSSNKEEGNGWFSMSFGSKRTFTSEDKDSSNFYTNAHLSLLEEEYAFSKITGWLKDLLLESLLKGNEILDGLKTILNQELLPNGITFEGVREGENRGEYRAIFLKDGEELSINELSDGYKSILILTLEILRQVRNFYADDEAIFGNIKRGIMNIPISGVILIDEIDAHLHPTWQTRIGNWFTQYFPNIQFIVTTHSPLICRSIGENGTIWMIENGSAREVLGTEKLRLRLGNISEAYGTGDFGEGIETSEESKAMRNRLAKLNIRSIQGNITQAERDELDKLRSIFPTKYDTITE